MLQNRTTGEKVLSVAGTDRSSTADLITDLVNIAVYSTVLGMPQYNSLESFYAQLVSSGKLGSGEPITVTGHSLGGFLTQAFTARHTSVVSAAYTYNSPGFGTAEQLLGFFGFTDWPAAAAKITNVHATNGVSMTAGLGVMLGTSQPVKIEADTNPLNNHSVVALGDALAIYETYSRLQTDISISQAGALFASSGIEDRRLEAALDTLRTVFIGAASNDANTTPTGNRDQFYLNLQALQNNATFKDMSGQVKLVLANPGFAWLGQSDTDTALAYRFALLELQPFAVVASTNAQNQILYGYYTQRLSLFDPQSGQGELTASWMRDRAAMLNVVVKANSGNENFVYDSALIEGTFFEDVATGTSRLAAAGQGTAPQRFVTFGGEGADTLPGAGRSDALYGGGGADTLTGLGGNDYLEGNAGADSLGGG